MNGKMQSSHVKNETTYNIPLLINENVISSGISLISLWHTYADEHYRVIWPRDKKKPLIANSWVAVYTVQGCGKILLKGGEHITLTGNCIIFLKPTDIKSYHCEGLVWEQYWMEFTPTSVMDIPLRQQSIIYNGDIYNQELAEISQLITSSDSMINNLAVAFLTKIIYQWICLIYAEGKKDPQRMQIEKLIATLHASLQKRW
ncbi:AraC family ligand binding domain-containing protein, partial [Citrobacter freundii]